MAHAVHAEAGHEEAHAAEPAEPTRGWPVAFLLLLATTAVTLWALLQPRAELPPAPPPPAAAAAPADAGLGPLVERALPTGARINVPLSGVEGRLLAFIQDASRPADRATWFDFDRLTFDTASATLHESSRDQLGAVSAILAAFPAVKLKIGGYTDNVGDAASNQKLSERRAAEVREALVRLGTAPDRLTAEGYGEQFPVGDNATAEGRAMNRRISMRVMEK
jgi:outer membrane protein OmpA-like peptidoglycan-associated protein